MKTIYDLLQLISDELKMAEPKLKKYTFDVNLKYGWLSMYEHSEMSTFTEGKWQTKDMYEKDVFVMKPIKTESQIQEAYWAIYNNGRSGMKG
jgi:hypothetical protein